MVPKDAWMLMCKCALTLFFNRTERDTCFCWTPRILSNLCFICPWYTWLVFVYFRWNIWDTPDPSKFHSPNHPRLAIFLSPKIIWILLLVMCPADYGHSPLKNSYKCIGHIPKIYNSFLGVSWVLVFIFIFCFTNPVFVNMIHTQK